MKAQLVIKDFTKPIFLITDGYVIFQYGGSWKKALERTVRAGLMPLVKSTMDLIHFSPSHPSLRD